MLCASCHFFSCLGLPFRTSILIVIFLFPLLSFYADIFIINPCGSHVNPRSAEWIISMIFSLFRFLRMVAVTRTSSTFIHSSCVHNVQSLLGVIFDLVGIIFFLTDRFSFLLYLLRGMGKFPSASIVYCLHSSCVHNTPSLLGVNLSFNYCFLPSCLARFIFPFCCSGSKGWKPLASYVSQHSIFQNCNAGIPCLLE